MYFIFNYSIVNNNKTFYEFIDSKTTLLTVGSIT